jgi:hypothetical protein
MPVFRGCEELQKLLRRLRRNPVNWEEDKVGVMLGRTRRVGA